MHFAFFSTGPSDIGKSDSVSHLSSSEQFLFRRMVGTTLGCFGFFFFGFYPPQIPGFSDKHGLHAWSSWYLEESRPHRYWITQECAADCRAFHIQVSTTTNSHLALSPMRSTEIVSNSRSNFHCSPTHGKSVLVLPMGEQRNRGDTSRVILLESFYSSSIPLSKEKGAWSGCLGAPHGYPGFKTTTTDDISLFLHPPQILLSCSCPLSAHCWADASAFFLLAVCTGVVVGVGFFLLIAVTHIWAQGRAKTQWGSSVLVLVTLLAAACFWLGLILEAPWWYGCSNQRSQEERRR